jgi:hypothetical protein
MNREFMDKVFWNEYLEYTRHFEMFVEELTTGLINKIHKPAEVKIEELGNTGDA